MHIEVQVALNFVISYLYNKLPRRRVNLFGEELEKALKDKFQGHWYPEKPFKGSAFRCLKTGDPVDSVLDRAARESGVPISDILENLPSELAVWVDPGEVSYRIGEKGAVKILFSENNDHSEDSSADREVTKTFNPEAQCFRPIDTVSSSMNGLSLSPKTSPQGSPPTSSSSPTYKGGNVTTATTSPAPGSSFLPRSQAPLTFTTATFAQTKFGSTKLKTSSKRANRMSPTEFSNYIKQRAMQQQLHHSHGGPTSNHFGPIGPASPSRSLSPNPLALGLQNDPFYFSNIGMGMYPQFNGGPRNVFDSHYHPDSNGIYSNPSVPGKFSPYMEPHNGFYGMNNQQQQQQQQSNCGTSINTANGVGVATNSAVVTNNNNNNNNNTTIGSSGINNNNNNNSNSSTAGAAITTTTSVGGNVVGSSTTAAAVAAAAAAAAVAQVTPISSPGSTGDSKLIDGLNSFYSNAGPYQHLLVAN